MKQSTIRNKSKYNINNVDRNVHKYATTKTVSTKKVRRGNGLKSKGKKGNTQNTLIIGNNIAAFSGKKESVDLVIDDMKPSAVMLQETKLYHKGQVKVEGYDSFESLRNPNEGGGLLTLVHQKLNPVLIPIESDSKVADNVLVTEADLGLGRIR